MKNKIYLWKSYFHCALMANFTIGTFNFEANCHNVFCMEKEFTNSLGLNKKELKLKLISYEEEGYSVLYSFALDLYGYGSDEKQAFLAFEETLSLYMEYAKTESTLEEDLKKLGWKKHLHFKNILSPPDFTPQYVMLKKGINSFNVVDKQLQF